MSSATESPPEDKTRYGTSPPEMNQLQLRHANFAVTSEFQYRIPLSVVQGMLLCLHKLSELIIDVLYVAEK